MIRFTYLMGGFLGLSGVVLGAMGAHALKEVLEPAQLGSFETAVRFQMYHALLLILLGAILERHPDHPVLHWSARLVAAGVLLFSGSIYLLVLTPLPVGPVTPIGGVVLIAGWALLLFWAIRQRNLLR